MQVNTNIKYGRRTIADGKQYDKYISSDVKMTARAWKNGDVFDTLKIMHEVVNLYYKDVEKLAAILEDKKDVGQTLFNIWHFVFNHIQYTKDNIGVEVISRPARLWKNRKGLSQNTDCDCMAVFIASCLKNLKIKYAFRMTGYAGGDYQHVYVIVNHKNKEYILDGVVHQFNIEVPYSKKYDSYGN